MGLLSGLKRVGTAVATGGLSEAARAIGKDKLLGGTSKKPGDEAFKPPAYEHQGQIDEAIRRGLGTGNVAPQATMGGQFRDAQTQQLGQLQRIASGQDKGAGELAAQRQVRAAAAGQQAM